MELCGGRDAAIRRETVRNERYVRRMESARPDEAFGGSDGRHFEVGGAAEGVADAAAKRRSRLRDDNAKNRPRFGCVRRRIAVRPRKLSANGSAPVRAQRPTCTAT